MADVAGTVGKGAEICSKLAGIVKKEEISLICDGAGWPVSKIAKHAEECLKKSQCLKIKAYSVPYCVGEGDGCCDEDVVGTWVNP